MMARLNNRQINEGHINEDIVLLDDNFPHCKLLVSIQARNFESGRRDKGGFSRVALVA